MAKKLNQQDLLKLTSIDTPPTDSVAFGAKSDGLYQKVGTTESKLSTTAELLDRVKTAVPANAKFTDTTYTTGTLTQLNAGSDTTGRLQTAKLLNDWLNPKLALKATPADISTAIDGIEIGGRNLLLNSGREISFSEGYAKTAFTLNLKAGTYTYSLKQKGTGFIYIYYNGTSNNYGRTVDTHYDDYTKIVKTFTVKEGDVQPTSFFVYRKNEDGFTVSFKDFKLEKGTQATDWTPAPEDQVSDWNTTDITSFSYIKNKPTQLSQFTDDIGVASHISNKANPHNVTKSQVGLGNVDNVKQATQSDIDTAINAVEIGGRNLLRSFKSSNWGGLTGSDVIVVSPYEIIRKSPYVSKHYSETNVYIEGGNTFTFSGRIGGLLTIYEYDSENTRIRTVVSYQNIQKITFTTLPQTAHLNIVLSVLNLPDGDYSFSNVKLEKGNKPTDWTPAPEDQVSDWSTTDASSFSYIKNKPTKLTDFANDLGNYGSWITKAQGDGYYAPKSHSHSYLPLTGGTLSGEVSIVKSGQAGANTRFLTLRDTDYSTNQGRVDIAILATNANTETNRGAVISMRRTNNLGTLHFEVANNNLLSLIGHSQNVGIGTTSPSYKLDVSGTGRFTGNVTANTGVSTPKVDFGNGFTIEPSGTELVFKYNGVTKQRFLSDGSIVAAGEVTAITE